MEYRLVRQDCLHSLAGISEQIIGELVALPITCVFSLFMKEGAKWQA